MTWSGDLGTSTVLPRASVTVIVSPVLDCAFMVVEELSIHPAENVIKISIVIIDMAKIICLFFCISYSPVLKYDFNCYL
jgi:hypothetical protein